MSDKRPQPNLRTPVEQLNEVEKAKRASNMIRGRLHEDFRDLAGDDVAEETEQLAKSHGVYLEYNRAQTGKQKDWVYMVRVTVPGGGAFTRDQWRIFDELSDRYTANPAGIPSLRLTTRQNVQFHWVHKKDLLPLVQGIAATGFFTLNGCGDNVRNVMACPLSRFSDVLDAHALARETALYFRLPAEPHIQVFGIDPNYLRTPEERFHYGDGLLNRKFKIAFATVHRDPDTGQLVRDNCVEARTNDLAVVPVIEGQRVAAFQVFIGGGQGEKNGKPTFAALGQPLGVFTRAELARGLDAVVQVQQEWGDRQNRHWARLKYVVQAKGVAWFQERVRDLGAAFEQPIPGLDPGPRQLHHGWVRQPVNGRWAFGAYIENGRLIDGPNGDLKKMVRHVMDHFDVEMMTTPNQDLLFTNVSAEQKQELEAALRRFGWGQRRGRAYSNLRVLSGACVGLYTCRLSYAESEQFEPELIDQLEDMGYGQVRESIGITGCERQCFRPATKSVGWIGQGPDLYGLKIGGSEDGRHQGAWLVAGEQWYLRQVPRRQVAVVTAALFDLFARERTDADADLGAFLRRLGAEAVVAHLKENPATAELMKKTAAAPYLPPAPGAAV